MTVESPTRTGRFVPRCQSWRVECQDFVADCRIRAATDLLAHTWDPVVLAALRRGPRRRRDLRLDIGGISDKVLTESLHRLTGHGLVARSAVGGAPIRVDYALTTLGETLVDGPLAALGQWSVAYGDDLLAAQGEASQESG